MIRISKTFRITTYICLLFVIIIFIFLKLGFFDQSEINIEKFKIKKPLFYRSSILCNKSIDFMQNYYMCTVSFKGVFNNKFIYYNILKKKETLYFSSLKEDLKVYNIDFNNCNISKEKLLESANIFLISIYKYPFVVRISDFDKSRVEKVIKQVCNNSKIIYLPLKN